MANRGARVTLLIWRRAHSYTLNPYNLLADGAEFQVYVRDRFGAAAEEPLDRMGCTFSSSAVLPSRLAGGGWTNVTRG